MREENRNVVKRTRRPSVEPEQRRDWFRRFEEGQPVLKIARDSGYDSRTVKAQIQKEREEQDMREAKTAALRMALQDHYKDCCTIARRLSDKVAGDSGDLTELEAEDLWPGLREHLVRAPLWRRLAQWRRLCGERKHRVERLVERCRAELANGLGRPFVSDIHEMGLNDGAALKLAALCVGELEGNRATDAGFLKTPVGTGLVDVDWEPHHLGRFSDSEAADLRQLLLKKAKESAHWKECQSLSPVLENLRQVQDELREELKTIYLKRVIPGRCKYCPL